MQKNFRQTVEPKSHIRVNSFCEEKSFKKLSQIFTPHFSEGCREEGEGKVKRDEKDSLKK